MRRAKINKADFSRVLVTETVPFETPVIFSNDGLYECLKKIDKSPEGYRKLVDCLVLNPKHTLRSTIPFIYKINKGNGDFRRLFLIHPYSQTKAIGFYKEYEDLIVENCSISPASIRSPIKIASTVYSKSAKSNIYKFKNGGVTEEECDNIARQSPSYFAYRGYDRLYKFFESPLFMELESKYFNLKTLDVSKCFDSIYTHSMSWALKDKDFTKRNIDIDSTFGQEFDGIIRHMNYGETNGIPIGPEMSRIFAEIIFQRIDVLVINRLKLQGYFYDKEYSFKRYVDDVYIFAKTNEASCIVYKAYVEQLVEFNLHANKSKTNEYTRPFVTNKSRLIFDAKRIVNEFIGKFLENGEGHSYYTPLQIRSKWNLSRSFIESIKSACADAELSYHDISPFIVSVISARIKKLASSPKIESEKLNQDHYLDSFTVLIDLAFFFYSVSPSVSSSYRLCSALLITLDFFESRLPAIHDSLCLSLYGNINSFINSNAVGMSNGYGKVVPLETVNIALLTCKLPAVYRFDSDKIEETFLSKGNINYFGLISAIYYMRDDPKYSDLRGRVVKIIINFFDGHELACMSSEKMHLILDLLSCPFIDRDTRKKVANKIAEASNLGRNLISRTNESEIFDYSEKNPIYVDWNSINMLMLLNKKQLRKAY